MQSAPPRLLSLATAIPPHQLRQDAVKAMAERSLGSRHPGYRRLFKTFDTSGVDTRYSVVPIEWFEEPKDWPARHKAYLEGAKALYVEVATQALAESGWQPADVDTVVTVSSTGIAMPSLDAHCMRQMGFRRDVERVPLSSVGCAGGATGLAIASRFAAASPGHKVLLVCVDACTLSFRLDQPEKADVIGTVLFGDGAAAACISTDASTGPIFGTGQQYTWYDTLRMMGWDLGQNGFGVILDYSIPDFVKQNLANAVESGLQRAGTPLASLARVICHPGSIKVVAAIETALQLEEGTLDHERDVLREFSNMSSPTVLFVLKRVMETTTQRGDMLMAALGPGFTASMLPIRFE